MSKNLLIFFLLVGGLFFYVHKNMKTILKKNNSPKTTQSSTASGQEETEYEDDDAEYEDETEEVSAGSNAKVSNTFTNYPSKVYKCPEKVIATPYGLRDNPSTSGPYFQKTISLSLSSNNIDKKKIRCEYSGNFSDTYYLYESIEGYNCRKIQNKNSYQCYDSDNNNKKFSCWEIRTTSSEQPYLRFNFEAVNGSFSRDDGWEYVIPKAFAQSSRITNENLLECAYQFESSSSFVIENKVPQFKECYQNNKGYQCN
ncbi:MAG: hypothetical protein KC493_00095 [Bacteriovoracaceae bacterium]|nr:hypothetical protein [Bacteriovoracaceae bacterium]